MLTRKLTPQMPRSAMTGIILAVIGSSLWGVMGIFVRRLSSVGYSSYDIAFIRCLLAGTIFLLLKFLTDRDALKIDIKGLLIAFFYGSCSYAAGFAAYGVSVARIPVAVATVLMFMSPIWVSLLSFLLFKEKLTWQTVLILCICIVGAAMVANVFGGSGGSIDLIGILAGMLNGFCVALQIVIPRYFSNRYRKDTLLVYGFIGAAVVMAFCSDFQVISYSLTGKSSSVVLFNLICLGLLCTMVANGAVIKATEYIDTTTCSIMSSLEVIVGAVVGILLFNETMTVVQVLGAVLVVCGALAPTIFSRKASKY